jgi:hypothetical protein
LYRIVKSAESAYRALVRQLPEIESLFVAAYKVPPRYEDRIRDMQVPNELLARARNRRNELGMPFWDAVIAEALAIGAVGEGILDAALYHQPLSKNVTAVSRSKVLSVGIVAAVQKDNVPYPWAVLSRVRTPHEGDRHFPMLDFRCSVSQSNLVLLERVAERLLDCPWTIIQSVNSYHLIGASLMTYSEMTAFLGMASLLGPIVDRNYVAHQLINGIAALRIIGSDSKAGLLTCASTFPREVWEEDRNGGGKFRGYHT